jgi:hypothetical protein
MNYCSLEEAWGTNTSKGCNVHVQHKKQFETDNPIHTPNLNYECNLNKTDKTSDKKTLTGYQNKSLANYQPGSPIVPNNQVSNLNYQANNQASNLNNDIMFNKMNDKNQDLSNFIKTLNMDEATKTILISKISNAIDSIKLESNSSNDIREDFTNRYYRPSYSENHNVDILFLILLGLFIIFILDKK